MSRHHDLSKVIEICALDVHPPGYHVLLHYLIRCYGGSSTVMRLPSVIAGCLSIAAIFFLGKHLYSSKEGLVAALLMAVLGFPLRFSQEARPYSILILLSIVTIYFWIHLIECIRNSQRIQIYRICAYAVSLVLLAYLHYFGLYFVILQSIFMIALAWRHRSALLRVMIAYVVVFLAYLPWIEVIAKTLRRNTFWIKSPSGIPTSFLSYFTELFNRSPTITLFAAAAIIILLFWGIYDIVTSKTSPRAAKTLSPGLLLIAWFLIPFLGAWIISKTMIPVLTNRNLVISLPAAYLLVSRSLVRISARLKLKFLIMLIIAAALLYHLVFIRHYYSAPHHRQYSKAADYIMLCDQQLKKSIIITHVPKFILNGYFFRKSFVKKEIFDPTNAQPYLRDTLVLPEQEQVSHVWYISGGARAHEKESIDRDALVFLEQHFKLIGKKNFFLTTAWLYKKKDTTEGKHSPREGIAH